MSARRAVVTAESGCDLSAREAAELGVEIVPMHLSIAGKEYADGELVPEDLFALCKSTGETPKTCACSPTDYANAFDRAREREPKSHVVHLAYSAATTSSFQFALLTAQARPWVTVIDTKSCSGGQGLIVERAAKAAFAGASAEDVANLALELRKRMRVAFLPSDLGFLKAGGRLTNAQHVGAHILKMKPMVEIRDGLVVATGKVRGRMQRAAATLVHRLMGACAWDTDEIALLSSAGLSPETRRAAEEAAAQHGFKRIRWRSVGGVVASHCGPAAFGVAALMKAG